MTLQGDLVFQKSLYNKNRVFRSGEEDGFDKVKIIMFTLTKPDLRLFRSGFFILH